MFNSFQNYHFNNKGNFMIECPYCGKKFKNVKGHIWAKHTIEGNNHKPQKGKIPWNKGLTKETNDIVLKHSLSLKKTIKEKIKNGTLKGCCTKDYIGSEAHKKSCAKGGGYRKNLGRGKKGYYKDIWCDSSWELAFVLYHIEHNIEFKRNWKKFEYNFEGKSHTYIPDFIYPNGTFIEVKGYLDKRSIEKAKQFTGRLIVLQYNEMKDMLEYVKNKYGQYFYKNLYNKKE